MHWASGFPCALCFRGAKNSGMPRAKARRGNAASYLSTSLRAKAQTESNFLASRGRKLDCFVASAPRNDGGKNTPTVVPDKRAKASADPGPILRVVAFRKAVETAIRTTNAGGYGSLLSQGRREIFRRHLKLPARLALSLFRTDHHPGNPELIDAHPEALREEGLRERHVHGAALGQRLELAFGLSGIFDRQ